MGPWHRGRRASREFSGPVDAILALDFGMRLSGFPLPDDPVCESNREMAGLVCGIVQFHNNAWLIAQDEIGRELKERHPAIDKARLRVISGHETKPSKYLDTREFLCQAVERIKSLEHNMEMRFHNILLICHHAHLWRAKRTLEQVLFEAKLGSVIVRIPARDDLKSIPYDRKSSQWWTRGPVRWWFRELLVAMPWYKFRRWI